MHRIILENVGPIKKCEMDINSFNVFTGAQASGKSTVAKSIFFFRTVKDDIRELIIKRATSLFIPGDLLKDVTTVLRNKFLQIFGSSRALSNKLRMEYRYGKNTFIEITLKLKKGEDYISPNYVFFEFSDDIETFLKNEKAVTDVERSSLRETVSEKLNALFSDESETIFIPAGRSLITLLTSQLNYIFTSMDEIQRRSIDFCTQKYVERILKIRTAFNEGLNGYYGSMPYSRRKHNTLAKKAITLTNEILKGRYVFSNGEERLVMDDNRFIKINYTSSGQQETVWIFNILIYQLINDTKTFVILEEPEAHLYPDAQKKITELLGLFLANKNQVFITTHSPYVLGTVNNLLYAKKISNKTNDSQVAEIIEKDRQISKCNAWFVKDGTVTSCIDPEDSLIINEVIDGASAEINEAYDALFDLSLEE